MHIDIELDDDLQTLIETCRDTAPELAPLKDMGMTIPDEAIVRKALILGLKTWTSDIQKPVAVRDVAPPVPPTPVEVPDGPIHVPAPTPEPQQAPAGQEWPTSMQQMMQQMQAQLQALQNQQAQPQSPTAVPEPTKLEAQDLLQNAADLSATGMPQDMGPKEEPPPNWNPWPISMTIPEEEKEIHHHYGAAGWGRWIAATPRGDTAIYWSHYASQRRLQPASPYIQVVDVPGFGVAHVVPPDLRYRLMGADGAEMREKIAQHQPETRRSGASSVVKS